jgi:hypothetical protein
MGTTHEIVRGSIVGRGGGDMRFSEIRGLVDYGEIW